MIGKGTSPTPESPAWKAKVSVHMGTCGISAGARDIMAEILRLIEAGDSDDILIRSADCIGICSHEPLITVETEGSEPVVYADLTVEKVRRIYREHVLGGKPVNELALR